MARDLENDIRRAHPDLWSPDEEVVGVFGALPRGSGLARANERVTGALKNAADEEALFGHAESVPRETRFVAVTDTRVVFFAGRWAWGGGAPSEVLAEVAIADVAEINVLQKGHYVGFVFADGSAVAMLTNRTKQFQRFARAHAGDEQPS